MKKKLRNITIYRAFSLLTICAVFLFVNCEQPYLLSDLLDEPEPLTLSPASAQVVSSDSIILEASGGVPPYTYTLITAVGGTGENFSESTYTAPSDASGTAVIQIMDSYGSTQTASIDVVLGAGVSTADIDYIVQSITNSPASAYVNTSVSQSFTFTNQGTAPGAYTVYWTAYISSDTVLDGGDTSVSSSSATALGASVTSGSIAITGNWPATPGIYYLIVKVSAGDDIDHSNDYLVSAPFTINAVIGSDIDYIASNVSRNYPTATLGGLYSETFDLSNIGGLAGTQPIDWTAYASLDSTLEVGTDIVIGSGTTSFSGLAAGASYSGITISGSWPNTAGIYYLIVAITSSDETITGNNSAYSGTFTVKNPPDYMISAATLQTEGVAGAALSMMSPRD